MRWYRNINFLYNMKKVTIVFDFESQSMDVSVNDARECVTPATTVEEMLANEVFVPADLQSANDCKSAGTKTITALL